MHSAARRPLEITPLTDAIGAEVSGIDGNGLTPADRDALDRKSVV
jgi:hypothetical protein